MHDCCSNEVRFCRILKEVAYKMLENPELGKVSSQTWLIKIFGYLRTICCSFDVYPKVASELVSMMKHLDYLAAPSLSHNPFVHAIEANNSDEVMDPLYLSMLTYLGKLAPSDFSKPDVSARPFALFITTLAEKKSRLLNKYVANITLFLGNEPAIMRSAVLIAFVEVVCNIYSGNLPDGHARATRDRLLLYVQDHINDMNVNVRSRALQLWTRLAESERIPISFIKNGLIRDAGARLEDKSVTVRKNAAAFLKTLLEYNTLNSSLQVDGFLEELQKLLIKRKDLINKNPENGTAKSVMEKWSTVQGEVTDWIHECVEAYQNEKFTEDKTQDEEGIMKDASNPRKRLKALSEKELTQYVLGTRNIDDLDCSRFIFILDEHYPSESKEILHLTASLCRKLSAESNECRVGIQVLTGYLLSKQLSGVEM
ncbi:hypothetical protein AB6A40_008942 [Gnathostoma spinigerum]|uniref:Condensin complex subunit 1 n=1 Tax=Gnathostoma spinigerum TaxID=75299 RepID=A0ABD6EQW8_9BILA